jgi:hypothetical protein
VALMAGLPLPAPRTALNQLDGLLLVKLPFKDDLRQFTFRTFNDPSKPHVSQAATNYNQCQVFCHPEK